MKKVMTTCGLPVQKRKPDIVGTESEKLFTLRTVEDTSYQRFIDKNKLKSAVMVGGGFIGLEVAGIL